jgi:hypothetical protein
MASIPSISTRATPAEIQRFARAVKNFLESGGLSLDTKAIASQIDRALRDYEEQTTDLTPPGPPENLVVTGLFDKIMLEWGPATGNVAYYEVFRNMVDDLGNAVMVSPRIGAAMWVDTPPDSSLSATYYYWVRAVSPAGIVGPFNAAAGTPGSTADDPAYVLEVLTGEITEGQLYQDLNTRIDKIEVHDLAIEANETAISNEQTVRQDADYALAQDISTVWAKANDNTSAIRTEQIARAYGDSALAQDITTLQSTVGANTTSLQTKAETSDLNAVYEVKLDINGRVTGFGLVGGATSTEFGINADRFWVADPSDSANVKIPFVIDNGQVVMDVALIRDATITNAKIKSVAADKITAGTITAAITTIGQYLRSSDSTVVLDMANKLFKMRSSAGHEVEITPGSVKFKRYGVALPIFEFTGDAVIIRNTSGQTLLQSGGYIQYDMVDGGPPSDADKTGSNKAYDTYRVGGDYQDSIVRAGNKITASNQATYISSLLVGNAWIGNAAVNTLQIAGNAVTVPVSAKSGTALASAPTSGGYGWLTVFSFPMNSEGQPIHVSATFDLRAVGAGDLYVKVKYTVGSTSVPERDLAHSYAYSGTSVIESPAFTVMDELPGTSTSQTITMQVGMYTATNASSNRIDINDRRLLALGVKR